MRARTESEIKAYVDGYNACYKQFCECLKIRPLWKAVKKMDLFVTAVRNCIEDEQTERREQMSDAWNLGDGLENVCRSVLRKAHYASHQTEERPRTIINLDAYEITALIWAMDEYIRKGASR